MCKLKKHQQKLPEREKGSFCFLIIVVSYNARYVKYREVKKAYFPDFGVSGSAGSLLDLALQFCEVCAIYHILLFYLPSTYKLFLHGALCCFMGFVLFQLFRRCLCVCFAVFHAAFYNLSDCFWYRHHSGRFCQNVSADAPAQLLVF